LDGAHWVEPSEDLLFMLSELFRPDAASDVFMPRAT
jgi:hypothetical protein